MGIGLSIVWRYENTPGVGATPPSAWPVDSKIDRAADRATLVLVVHPHCPCSRASLGELSVLMAHSQGRMSTHVLFIRPIGFSEDWEKTDLWKTAAAIPGVQVLSDVGGVEARRFQSATSGQAILYDAQGVLLFSGGITGSRGHSGDNAGRSAIVSLLNHERAEREEAFVFGCPLFEDSCRSKDSNDDPNIN